MPSEAVPKRPPRAADSERSEGYRLGLSERLAKVCRGMGYRSVASWTGSSHESARRYILGITRPDPEFLARVCEEFGVSAEWLLCGRGSMFWLAPGSGRRRRRKEWSGGAAVRVPGSRATGDRP